MDSYPGGKGGAGVFQRIVSLMPPHEVYVEPFLGGGAVLRAKRPARWNVGVDLDSQVVAGWRNLVDSPAAARVATLAGGVDFAGGPEPSLFSALSAEACTVGGGDEVLTAGPGDAGRRLAAPLARPGDARSRRRRSSGMARGSAGEVLIAGPGDARARWLFLEGDGVRFLRGCQFGGEELVYCDPPYVLSTLRSRCRYSHLMTDAQHRELLELLRGLPCRVMISGYWSPLYARVLRGWRTIQFRAMTRGGVAAEEWLWCNFDPPARLHDYRYLGSGFRERERLKRLQQRWRARLQRMPPLERSALLAAIADTGVPGVGMTLSA